MQVFSCGNCGTIPKNMTEIENKMSIKKHKIIIGNHHHK